jgi:hypothetical protein
LRDKWQQKLGYEVEAPNDKHQITNKFLCLPVGRKGPNSKRKIKGWSFEIEIWDLFGICNLIFGISTLIGSGYPKLGS